MAKSKITTLVGAAAVRLNANAPDDRDAQAMATRYLLQLLSDAAPGGSVEVRIPPHGAVQVVEGPEHNRGTPPNVVETDPATWIALATGKLSWGDAVEAGRVSASGSRADISELLPLDWGDPAAAG